MFDPCLEKRQEMVEQQMVGRGIREKRLLRAFLRVPRHEFVPQESKRLAYADRPLPIGFGQTISQPYMVARMTNLASPQPGDRVLEIGTGSGYQTAILAEIAKEVFTVERVVEIATSAKRVLRQLRYPNIRSRVADGTLGWKEAAPFDVMLVTAGAPEVPKPLLGQLALGGRLVIPIQDGRSQVLYTIKRTRKGYQKQRGERCAFVPLIGKHGWGKSPSAG